MKKQKLDSGSDGVDASIIKLNVRGKVFEVSRDTLLKVKNTYFTGLLPSGAWLPDADGSYSIDRPSTGMENILEYMRTGKLSLTGLDNEEKECVYSNLDYFLVPYARQWPFTGFIDLEGFERVQGVCEIDNAKLCGATANSLVVWDLAAGALHQTMSDCQFSDAESYSGNDDGLDFDAFKIVSLGGDQVCTHLNGDTKVWCLDSASCKHSWKHDADIKHMIVLHDGRLCLGYEKCLQLVNVNTGVVELTIPLEGPLKDLVQMSASHRICIALPATIQLWDISTESFVSSVSVNAFLCKMIILDESRVCCMGDTIHVYDVNTGEELMKLGGSGDKCSICALPDGRVCSNAWDFSVKFWDVSTGKVVKRLSYEEDVVYPFFLLRDGRLAGLGEGSVRIWS